MARFRAVHVLTEAYPAFAKSFLHSRGWMVATRAPICRQVSSIVRVWAVRIQCLILAKVCSIGLRSGE